ncbi:SpoIIE family protein phosphatase [Paracrocinitomix mangrovi]|uniref:SpoIIE family protein phosphatase n=1 Tax=Paracrocinitomix mangrovi TaxID=2862509 RepID=UPI001C8E52B7|nr:SpoIIE family protein phosphatase [Paracrocinitomix mangrovi]UKN01158.1 SpoIIE family protein phosphatase [Paracrocinitomix mangrovi]
MGKIFAISLILISFYGFGQPKSNDELAAVYNNHSNHDSLRADAAIEIANRVYFFDLDSAQTLIQNAKKWSLSSNYKYGLARVDGFLGFIHHVKGEYLEAIESYTTSIDYNLKNGFDIERAMDLGNYGGLLVELKDPKALDCYKQSIEIYEKHNATVDLAFLYANVAQFYAVDFENDSSLIYLYKALPLAETDDSKSTVYSGLTRTHLNKKNLDSADYYSKKAFEQALILADSTSIRRYYQVQMEIKYGQNQIDSALYFGKKAQTIKNVTSQIIYGFNETYSAVLHKKGRDKEAFVYLDSAYRYFRDFHSEEMKNAAFRNAVSFEYKEMRLADSLNYLREEELKEAEHQKELAVEAQRRYILYGGMGLLAVVLLMAYRGYRRKKQDNEIISKQKREVEEQKMLVDEKNTEILDSIQYAKRIQTAILPSEKTISELLPNSFILYKPKDIVAGDFYWIEPIPESGGVLIAAADCTGHGVPGAMVSVICNNALNRSVREYKLTDPGKILDQTRELVISEFQKSTDEVKDGMDIALVSLTLNTKNENEDDTNSHSSTHSQTASHSQPHSASHSHSVLKYSGAHNPLWIIKRGSNEIIEVKADKQPIGKFDHAKSFTTHEITVESGDQIYLFSDGFIDQFGGPKGKKFKASNFKELLLSVAKESPQKQKQLIDEAFESWKSSLEQLDDVCVIGVRI